MRALTAKLLVGSGVDEASHPSLVALLELAAGASAVSGSDGPAVRKRLVRQWERVRQAFGVCVSAGVKDSALVRASDKSRDLGLVGYRDGERVWWEYSPSVLSSGARDAVAKVLDKIAGVNGRDLQAFDICSLSDLRKALKANRLPSLSMPLLGVSGHVEGPLLPGRQVVVSWLIFGLKLFAVLQADEFGRLKAIAYRETVKAAFEAAGGSEV